MEKELRKRAPFLAINIISCYDFVAAKLHIQSFIKPINCHIHSILSMNEYFLSLTLLTTECT